MSRPGGNGRLFCGYAHSIPPGGIGTVFAIHTPTLYITQQQRTYTVAGMTCSHCVMAVREEVAEIPGVSGVDVDLAGERLTVAGAGFSDDAVAAAVAAAGYEVIA